jgi:serine/threonine-protein kinase
MNADEILADRYRLVRELGRGGMSVVWLADDIDLGRPVALKVMRAGLLENPDQRKRFEREAELAARLSDPHIVSLWERGELDDGSPYMAMEYVEGETLQALLEKGISAEELHWLFDQLLAGVEAAHRSGIVHRDLKPQNILISKDGEVKLADFGVAVSEENNLGLTEAGTVIGTARYLSPEQAHGEPATRRSDLYAVGIMLYEAWTGRTPWDGENMVSILAQQATTLPPPPSRFNSTVTEEIDRMVLKSIAYRSEERFQSAAEFRYALGHPGIFRKAPTKKRRAWLIPLALLMVIGLSGATYLLLGKDTGEMVTVPSLQGMQLIDARARLSELGLDSSAKTRKDPSRVGTVIEQTPGGGGQIEAGGQVLLLVSSGPGRVKVPQLAGMSVSAARASLDQIGLGIRSRYRSSEKKKGTVLFSRPGVGTLLPSGETVLLLVSSGPEILRVPDLFGMTIQGAIAELESLGISYKDSYVESDYPVDTVIGQSPTAGEPVAGTVQLEVSAGQAATAVAPDLLGMTLSQARAETAALGLGLAVRERASEDPASVGLVIEQQPEPGSTVDSGTVRIFIGALP